MNFLGAGDVLSLPDNAQRPTGKCVLQLSYSFHLNGKEWCFKVDT